MTATQIAKVVGTVGSPLIVISELLKNAVDISAENIDIFYDASQNTIAVNNDHRGFSVDEISVLATPGASLKKTHGNLENENGMFLTGSKGLGVFSVFLLCDEAEITTVATDKKIHKIILSKNDGSVDDTETDQLSEVYFTHIILKNVNPEVIAFLSSEKEVRKLRHICTYLFKNKSVTFPRMLLHISGQEPRALNFSCDFPPMLYDARFSFAKETGVLTFACLSPNKSINHETISLSDFSLENLQRIMLEYYGVKETIPTRTNELLLNDFKLVPSFEGRILVYEKKSAGAQLKTYGAGVNVYVNDFALYNYLAEENDWLGLADYSQRKKNTGIRPHNVFGYVDFPNFNENIETLQISNERADFIQDLTFTKLMYIIKGVMMFIMFNIDVSDKNPKYKVDSADGSCISDGVDSDDAGAIDLFEDDTTPKSSGNDSSDATSMIKQMAAVITDENDEKTSDSYSPAIAYKPKQNIRMHLGFTLEEGKVINGLKDVNNIGNKIYNIVFELSRLDLQIHRYSISFLYRALIESATKHLSQRQSAVVFNDNALETSIISALNYFSNISKKGVPFAQKTVKTWRETISNHKLIDILNEYIHNETPVDAYFLQESWNSIKGFIIACLTIK